MQPVSVVRDVWGVVFKLRKVPTLLWLFFDCQESTTGVFRIERYACGANLTLMCPLEKISRMLPSHIGHAADLSFSPEHLVAVEAGIWSRWIALTATTPPLRKLESALSITTPLGAKVTARSSSMGCHLPFSLTQNRAGTRRFSVNRRALQRRPDSPRNAKRKQPRWRNA